MSAQDEPRVIGKWYMVDYYTPDGDRANEQFKSREARNRWLDTAKECDSIIRTYEIKRYASDTNVSLLDALNAYQGSNPWEDVIYPHPDYDESRTAELEHGEGNYVATRGGAVLRLDSNGEPWREV